MRQAADSIHILRAHLGTVATGGALLSEAVFNASPHSRLLQLERGPPWSLLSSESSRTSEKAELSALPRPYREVVL